MITSKKIIAAIAVIYILIAIQLIARKTKSLTNECCPFHDGLHMGSVEQSSALTPGTMRGSVVISMFR